MIVCLVLGDLQRSPRTVYFARALNKYHDVDLVGFKAFDCGVQTHAVPSFQLALPFLLWAPVKVILQTLYLVLFLLKFSPKYLVVQNPPSIPTLLVAQVYCRLKKCKLIIDWHNLGHTILALKTGKNFIWKIARYFELALGRNAYCHFFVSQKMHDYLQVSGKKIVLYDVPQQFTEISPETKKEILFVLAVQFPALASYKDDFIIVSSTSWTADEDFNVLYHSLIDIELKYNGLKRIFVIVTGKGPLRRDFEKKIYCANFKKIIVVTGWVRQDMYPKALGIADIGVCLHFSSSGLDLPMKVVDMFGCGVPVLAKNYSCISELVTNNLGRTFNDSSDLANNILYLIQNPNELAMYRNNIKAKFKNITWDEEFKSKALNVFE